MRGFFGIGIWYPKNQWNIGSLFRSAHNFDANYIFTVGTKYTGSSTDVNLTIRHIPYFFFKDEDDFLSHIPLKTHLLCVEQSPKSFRLKNFCHQERSCYLLGNELTGIPSHLLEKYDSVQIDTKHCLNVAVAGSIIMYDRKVKINAS